MSKELLTKSKEIVPAKTKKEQQDIEDFLKEGVEKPLVFKNGKLIIPQSE